MRSGQQPRAAVRRSGAVVVGLLAGLAMLVVVASAVAASALHVTSRSWEVAAGGALHEVAAGGKLSYCASQPVTAITPTVVYTHAPVGKSYTVKLAAPAVSGTIPFGVKTPFAKSRGHLGFTYAAPSFKGHRITAGKYTFSVRVGSKTVTSLALTLAARTNC